MIDKDGYQVFTYLVEYDLQAIDSNKMAHGQGYVRTIRFIPDMSTDTVQDDTILRNILVQLGVPYHKGKVKASIAMTPQWIVEWPPAEDCLQLDDVSLSRACKSYNNPSL